MFSYLFVFLFFSQADFFKPKDFEQDRSEIKALVFLSSTCPCSQSHITHLESLVQQFPGIGIYGVMTDSLANPEERERVHKYFSALKIKVIEDHDMTLVKTYGALKTPHVSLFAKNKNDSYDKVYEGGVSNNHQFDKATLRYLQENLQALSSKNELKYKNGHSLGCYIRRI